MNAYVLWMLAALALTGIELVSGTFYLLMLALGAVAGAAADWFEAPLWAQWALAAMVALIGMGLLRKARAGAPARKSASRNPDVLADIGERVEIREWLADGEVRVWYRGAHWQGQLAEGQAAQAGEWRIVEVVGNRLILGRVH